MLDMVGGDYASRNLEVAGDGWPPACRSPSCTAPHADVNLSPLMREARSRCTGSTLRPRTVEEKGAIARGAASATCGRCIESGEVRPVLHAVFPLAEASLAHAELEAGQHVGKIVLRT